MKNLKILVLLLPLLLLSAFWGYQNHLQFVRCQEANQQLIQELKKASKEGNSARHFLEEGDKLTSPLILPLLGGPSLNLELTETCLLIFISTSCPACLEVALYIYSELRQYEERGLQIVSVSRNSAQDLTAVSVERNWPLPIVHDATGQLHRLLRIDGLPSVVLIERGTIRMKANALSIDRRLPELKAIISAASLAQTDKGAGIIKFD